MSSLEIIPDRGKALVNRHGSDSRRVVGQI